MFVKTYYNQSLSLINKIQDARPSDINFNRATINFDLLFDLSYQSISLTINFKIN